MSKSSQDFSLSEIVSSYVTYVTLVAWRYVTLRYVTVYFIARPIFLYKDINGFIHITLQVLMLYKLYNQGFVNSLDDSVTDYRNDFVVKNPFGSAPITLRWGFNFWV